MVKADGSVLVKDEMKLIFPLIAHELSGDILEAKLARREDGLTDTQLQEVWKAICDQANLAGISLKPDIDTDQVRETIARICSAHLSL